MRIEIKFVLFAVAAVVIGFISLAVLGAILGSSKKSRPMQVPIAVQSQKLPSERPVLNEPLQTAASAYAERVETYWLPEVAAMPDAIPADDAAIGKLISQFEGMQANIADGEKLVLNARERALRKRLIAALGRKQAKLFPVLRRRYASALDNQMFRRDIRVTSNGATLRLVGGLFARNANVEDVQTALLPQLTRLRFRRVEYRWNAQIGETLSYRLTPPSDATITR